jgi:phospholipase D1/2
MLESDQNDTSEPLLSSQRSGEVIRTDEGFNTFDSKESFDDQVDQDKVQVELQDLKAVYTSVTDILGSEASQFRDKDKFDVIKFTIKVKAVYNYQWDVFRKPSDIKKNFADVHHELSKNYMEPSGNKADIFTTVAGWTDDSIQLHISDIENYYRTLFQDPKIYNALTFKEFFNISVGSFNQYNSGSKPFEGYVHKKADPQCLRTAFSIACKCIEYFAFSQYNNRWIVVKDDCIYYMDKSNSETGKNVYFFDRDLEVKKEGRDIINIKNVSRNLILKFKTNFERDIWYKEIMKRAEAMLKILANNPFKSYTNEKKGNLAHWFTDGQDYFKDLSEKLMQAKETIFITDWWLSPEVWLVRPVPTTTYMALAYQNKNKKETGPYSRLMDILYQCANRGVKVYVLIYAECSLALTLNSAHSQHALEALHPNIQVERHPQNCTDLLWSHHEKLVIIDQIIGYVGGLDLCWGRWDTHEHPIYEEPNDKQEYNFPAIDYSNARIRDFDKVEDYLKESCDRNCEVRMPWHDVHSRLIGPVVADIARHFVERWNFSRFGTGSGITDIKQNASVSKHNNQLKDTNTLDEEINKQETGKPAFGFMQGIINQVNEKEKENALIPNEEEDNKESTDDSSNIFSGGMKMKGPTKLRAKRKLNKGNEVTISGSSGGGSKGPVDYTKKKGYEEEIALRERHLKNVEIIDEDHLYIPKGKTTGKLRGRRLKDNIRKIRQAQQNSASRAVTDINTNSNNNNINIDDNELEVEEPKPVPSFYNKFVKDIGQSAKTSQGGWFQNFLGQPEEKKLETNVVNVNFFKKGTKSRVQVLRSASKWSVGIGKKENSILQGYYQLIDNAKHYLYIENQFFVSRAFSEEERADCEYALSDVVENLIAFHIRKRIERAYLAKEKFRVFVFIPLLPGFAGEPESSGTLQIILKHTYAGICRNHGMSIIEQLEKIMGDKWKDYIGFYSLRGHGMVKGEPRTELVYIHSKLMIVDDKTVILGSANINDRSMLGTRDSEYAVMINETPKLNSKMDGKDYKAANFAYTFRVNLFAEHLGVDPSNGILADPLSDEFLQLVQNTAHNNTMIYRKLWGCYPDDQYLSFKDLREHKTPSKEELIENYNKEKSGIVGHAVEFPLHFLEKENLGIDFFSVENLVPERNFT